MAGKAGGPAFAAMTCAWRWETEAKASHPACPSCQTSVESPILEAAKRLPNSGIVHGPCWALVASST